MTIDFDEKKYSVLKKLIKIGSMVCKTDEDFSIIFLEDEFCEFLGYTKQELLVECKGKAGELIYAEDYKEAMESIKSQLASSNDFQCKYRIKNKDGGLSWVLEVGTRISDDAGNIIIHSILADINEIEVLRYERAHAFKDFPIGIAYCLVGDNDFFISEANDNYFKMLETTRKEYFGNVKKMTFEEDLPKLSRHMIEKAKKREPVDYEFRMKNSNTDKTKWYRVIGNFLRDVGNAAEYYCILIDVTPQQKEIAELRREKERYKVALGSSVDSVLEYTAVEETAQHQSTTEEELKKYFENYLLQGYERIIWIDTKTEDYRAYMGQENNFYAQPTYGVHDERIVFMKYYYIHKDDQERYESSLLLKNLKEILDTGEPEVIRYFRVLSPNNEYRWKCYRISYLDAELTTMVMCVQDIHDIRMEEQEQEESNRSLLMNALEETKKANETRHSYYEMVAKEVRTPLMQIGEESGLTEEEMKNPDALKEKLCKINQISSYLSKIIDDLSHMKQLDSGLLCSEREEVDLYSLIKGVCDEQKNKAEHFEIKVLESIHLLEDCFHYVDVFRIKKILENAIANAVKYSDRGSSVNLAINEKIVVDGESLLSIMVEDTGIYISEEYYERVDTGDYHDTFSDRTGELEGTGVSLALCRRLTELMGGSVKITHGNNGNNYFLMEIPIGYIHKIGKEAEDLSVGRHETRQTGEMLNQNILLVEAYENNYSLIGPLLKAKGAKFDIFYSGKDALEKWRLSNAGTYTAIIVDSKLKDMSYLRFVEKVRSSAKEVGMIPIIAVGENFLTEDIKKGYKVGINANITRPVNIKKLLQILNAMEGGV